VGGAIAGFATLIEFLFAPPAISLAIGAYLRVQFPSLDPAVAATMAYVAFVTLNIVGVHIAATFELFVTLLAVAELLVFMGVVQPSFHLSNFLAGGWAGRIISAWQRSEESLPHCRLRSGSSLRSKVWRWLPKRRRIRAARSRAPISRGF
jgi:amino acid transporter